MAIFEYDDYKKFVRAELKKRPNKGRGELSKIAKALNVHTTMISHIFRGDYELNADQGLALAEYFALSDFETDYLIGIINLARAGDPRSRRYFGEKVRAIKEKSLSLNTRIDVKNVLSEADQAHFYSSWTFAAIRLLTASPAFNNPGAIAKELNLSIPQTQKAIEFLSTRGLITAKSNGTLEYREKPTYVGRDNVFSSQHRLNWRLKAIERVETVSNTEMMYSNPVMIARKDFEAVTELVIQFIAEFRKFTAPSPSEILGYLGVDWLKITK